MIDPMATGTGKRGSPDLCRPRRPEAFSAHPPTPVDDTTMGSLGQRADGARSLPPSRRRLPTRASGANEPPI